LTPFAIVHICRAYWHDVVSPLVPDDDATTEVHEPVHVSLHLPKNILVKLTSVRLHATNDVPQDTDVVLRRIDALGVKYTRLKSCASGC